MRPNARNIFLTLLGVLALMLKRHYSGPHLETVHSYGGNIAASFAVYFVVTHLPFLPRFGKLSTAALALAVVELFEALDGFGVMTNTYDQTDFAANALGIALALMVDTVASGLGYLKSKRCGGPVSAKTPESVHSSIKR